MKKIVMCYDLVGQLSHLELLLYSFSRYLARVVEAVIVI